MADKTKIEWTDATWNPITGCSVVSPGCTNCYAMRLAGTRLKHHPTRAGLTVDSKAGPVWNGQVRFNEKALLEPLRWKRPRMIFVCAHGDLFAENVSDEWIDKVFAVMALAPQHAFQVLTKRPERMREYLTTQLREHFIAAAQSGLSIPTSIPARWPHIPLQNVWLGVSVEDQCRADERIPHLVGTPAAIRFISAEPLLGALDILPYLFIYTHADDAIFATSPADKLPELPWRDPLTTRDQDVSAPRLDWVIAGGESGPGARPMHPGWARSIRDQCEQAGVPFFFKQWGEWLDANIALDRIAASGAEILVDGKGWKPSVPLSFQDAHILAVTLSRRFQHHRDGRTDILFGKNGSGRLLDGVEHNAMPEVLR